MGFQSQVNSILNQAIGGAMVKGIKDTSGNVENVKQAVEDVKTATEGQTEQLKQIAALPEREEEEVKNLLNIGKHLSIDSAKIGLAMNSDHPEYTEDVWERQKNEHSPIFDKLSDKTKKIATLWYKDNLEESTAAYKVLDAMFRSQKDYDENVANNAMKTLDAGQKFQEDQKEALNKRQDKKVKYQTYYQKKGGRR